MYTHVVWYYTHSVRRSNMPRERTLARLGRCDLFLHIRFCATISLRAALRSTRTLQMGTWQVHGNPPVTPQPVVRPALRSRSTIPPATHRPPVPSRRKTRAPRRHSSLIRTHTALNRRRAAAQHHAVTCCVHAAASLCARAPRAGADRNHAVCRKNAPHAQTASRAAARTTNHPPRTRRLPLDTRRTMWSTGGVAWPPHSAGRGAAKRGVWRDGRHRNPKAAARSPRTAPTHTCAREDVCRHVTCRKSGAGAAWRWTLVPPHARARRRRPPLSSFSVTMKPTLIPTFHPPPRM